MEKIELNNKIELTDLLQEELHVSFNKVTIIGYRICETYHERYLAFLLNNKSGEFVFPSFIIEERTESSRFHYFLLLFFSRICDKMFEKGTEDKFIIEGVRKENNETELIVLVNMTSCILAGPGCYSRAHRYLFILPDEILNLHHCCNIPIHENVASFLMGNTEMLQLSGSDGNQLEIPVILYSGTHEKNIPFQYMFGKLLTKHDRYGMIFRFTDFVNAIRDGGWSKDYKAEYKYDKCLTEEEPGGKYQKGGILRYVVFLGNSLFMEQSETEFDSILCYPEYFLKNYKFQTPLTYSFIDKSTLKKTFDSSVSTYQIV